MKKVILLIGCLAVLASCKKTPAPETNNEPVATEQTAAPAEAQAEAQAVEAADPFPASEAIATKVDGFREADGVWTLYLVEALDGVTKLEILPDAVVVLADKSEVALANLDKTALNEKSASLWMKDGKVAHIAIAE